MLHPKRLICGCLGDGQRISARTGIYSGASEKAQNKVCSTWSEIRPEQKAVSKPDSNQETGFPKRPGEKPPNPQKNAKIWPPAALSRLRPVTRRERHRLQSVRSHIFAFRRFADRDCSGKCSPIGPREAVQCKSISKRRRNHLYAEQVGSGAGQ